MQLNVNLKQPQKLSPIAIIISIVGLLKSFWPIFLVIIINTFSGNTAKTKSLVDVIGYASGFLVAVIIIRLNQILQYFTTTFFVNDSNEFVYKTGLLSKKQTIIPLNKIQSLQSSQALLNRISNTYKVAIDTAGSKTTEAPLSAITMQQLQALQAALSTTINVATGEIVTAPNTTELNKQISSIQLSIVDFLKLCISENHLKTMGIVAAFVFSKLREVEEVLNVNTDSWFGKLYDRFNSGISFIILIVIFTLLVTIVISSIRLVIKYFGYEIKLDNKKMYVQWGLISTQQKTIYYNKIQMLNWHSNAFRRLLRLAILRVYAMGENDKKKEGHIELPITSQQQMDIITLHYQPNANFDNTYLTIHKSFIIRYTILIGLPVFIVSASVFFFIEKYLVLVSVLWLLYFIAAKAVLQKRCKIYVNEHCLKIYQGVWGTEQILLNWDKIQSIVLATSPYQRSHNLRDVVLYTAGKKVRLHYLPLKQAQFINDYTLYKLEHKQ